MSDTVSIDNIKEFRRACFNEFLAEYPEVCEAWLQHFGRRLDDVLRGRLNQEQYAETWHDWNPPAAPTTHGDVT